MKGYTLIEVLLSIALVALIAGVSVPVLQSFIFRNQMDTSAMIVARALRTAQTYSQSINGDSTWGVAFISNQVIVYKGTNYTSRDISYDQVYILDGIVISGLGEMVFSKLYGFPSSSGTVVLSGNSETRNISINEKGTINF